jgi:hypothetical protein
MLEVDVSTHLAKQCDWRSRWQGGLVNGIYRVQAGSTSTRRSLGSVIGGRDLAGKLVIHRRLSSAPSVIIP